jgi:hypothetical protein
VGKAGQVRQGRPPVGVEHGATDQRPPVAGERRIEIDPRVRAEQASRPNRPVEHVMIESSERVPPAEDTVGFVE